MHKTKQAALKAARDEMGAEVIEGVDFNLKNTGSGWTHEHIPPANAEAEEAQAKRMKPAAKAPRGKKAAKAPKAPKATKVASTPKKAATPKPAAPNGQSKSDLLVSMLTGSGSTSKEMEQATGWQPHSVRGYLGTLRKKGVNVISKKLPGEPTIYRIGSAPKAEAMGDVV